ncbi:MAG: hypothetical protein IPG79_06350 [Saprospiraceae bacterium]|nr:hypothetical protein [Saprospiraceae bacterium]
MEHVKYARAKKLRIELPEDSMGSGGDNKKIFLKKRETTTFGQVLIHL